MQKEGSSLMSSSAGAIYRTEQRFDQGIFLEELGLPVIWMPNSYLSCNQHGPHEHALAPLLREGLQIMAGLWWDIGAGLAPAARQRQPA